MSPGTTGGGTTGGDGPAARAGQTLQASHAEQPALGRDPQLDPGARASALVVLVVSVAMALLVSAVCSISEAVLLSVRSGQVETLARSGSAAGRLLRFWKRGNIEKPIAGIVILNTFAHTIGATFAGSAYQELWSGSLALFSVGFTVAVLLFSEIIPKTLGVSYADRLALPVAVLVRGITFVLRWPLAFTSWFARLFVGDKRQPVTSVEEIRLLAALGSREGVVGVRLSELIEGVVSLRELTARDVMVPRGGVAFLSGARPMAENLAVIRQSGHSRFPFTPSGELDDVDGIILAKDLLFVAESAVRWDEVKHPLLVVPEQKTLDQALRLFQEERKHLAVVVDEYGGTQGVVTLEDVLEEIVGEIEDETDRVEKMIVRRPDGVYVCRGRAEMRKLLRALGKDERVDVITVGGFVGELLRRVPAVGDTAEWKDLRFRVVKATRRQAERIEVERLAEQAASIE